MDKKNIEILKNKGIGVIATDTIYGLVGSALSPEVVERIYKVKNRTDGKGFIVLISSIKDLNIFGIEFSQIVLGFLNKYWPGKVSVEFICPLQKFGFLKKDGEKIAFRLPDKKDLIDLLKETGPLVAPSANPEGLPPAQNISEAKKYFGGRIDFYEDSGSLDSLPSTLVKINGDQIEILREGAVKIN